MKKITEVRSDYYNEQEKCHYIDVWLEGEEEGFSVAKIYENPLKIVCQEGREKYFASPEVQEEIAKVVEDAVLSSLFVVVEKYQDYKNCSATVWGYARTHKEAREILMSSLKERYEDRFSDEEDAEEALITFIRDRLQREGDSFVNDDGDSYNEFFIEEVTANPFKKC